MWQKKKASLSPLSLLTFCYHTLTDTDRQTQALNIHKSVCIGRETAREAHHTQADAHMNTDPQAAISRAPQEFPPSSRSAVGAN